MCMLGECLTKQKTMFQFIKIRGIVIPNSNIKNFFGIKVFSKVPKNIETIILCDIKSSHNTFLQLRKSFPNKKIIVPEILNIKKIGN